ncbi:RNA polymerase II transcriptional coactivator KELP-like [Andrographis paniculata]|uniref:RNA polymerase II transcriptional coactivator KELP-like n=1 Tax=Andrographis paniculata TaxID=175694 RepID=UPI0021E7C62D|nr:RNA polymerase II transcriptional coactivator KELP-like [Andrographis paniculata]XP_051137618.1 RNA polymerase II transcriptional coactivator KELP-like [Andrographis paniculata]
MDVETRNKIEDTVLEILKNANMDEATEFKIRKSASEKLGMDLSEPSRKKFVKQVVESYLAAKQNEAEEDQKAEEEVGEEEEEEEEEDDNRKGDGKEYDDEGGLIICRLSNKRRVTLSEFRGKTLVSIREYYQRDGKELPTSKGISLTPEQWSSFSKSIPAIEKAIKKMESR